ncbi:MAG: Na+/H+ antiporter [Filimonas sp.]|nr:Na+/H+ antiporter [Filimonas sp.]
MLEEKLLLVIGLLFVVSMLSLLSEKVRVPYPIFLVLAGLCISFIPNVPHITLEPDWVFIIFLPPLLYAAAWNTSWKEFFLFRRPISMLAFGLVIFTSAAVAIVSHYMIPGFSLAMGFLLGGIISPPDAVAATSVLQNFKMPRRITTILEGESLINDASSLIVFRFALAAISTGQFVLWEAGLDFVVVAGLGIIIGLAVAHIAYVVHRFLPTTPSVDTAITLVTPYLMYILAERFHASGVLAVVSGGLFLTFRSNDIFSYNSRIQTQSVWNTVVFLLNGVVFILIGLQLPDIIKGMENYELSQAIVYSIVISVLTIAIRIIWVFPGAYLPRILSKRIRKKEERPKPNTVFIVAWSGMRGVVSLASALSIPLFLSNGGVFPHRNLILFITFVVILFTLVLQGLSLPLIIKWLKITPDDVVHEHEMEQGIRLRLAAAVVDFMTTEYGAEVEKHEVFKRVKERYERMVEYADQRLAKKDDDTAKSILPKYRNMLLSLVDVRRNVLDKMRHEATFPDELIRKKEAELDLEEARLRK